MLERISMRVVLALVALSFFQAAARAQDFIPGDPVAIPLNLAPDDSAPSRLSLTSNQNFPDFIGFMTNPLQAIDPRALTQIWPIFMSSWFDPVGQLPGGNAQVYGAGINVALTDRFSVGMNQGGAAVINFNRLAGPFNAVDERLNAYRGTHAGWINLGGFAQYTLVEDIERQFLFTVGSRLEAPTGSSSVYQGHGQPTLSPYMTMGKGFGDFHVLNSVGYSFSLGEGRDTTNAFYGTLHFDYKVGRFYPLLEFNWGALVKEYKTDLPLDRGLANFGTINVAGDYLTISPGLNVVVVPNRFEIGAAYTTKLATSRDVDLDSVIVKMIFRY
jgi:hypothetical protein